MDELSSKVSWMTVVPLFKHDPEERHLNQCPKGREGVENGISGRRTRYWSDRRWSFGHEEGK